MIFRNYVANSGYSWLSMLRRAECGVHYRLSGRHLQAYANEMAWREDARREPNGSQYRRITNAALHHPVSEQLVRLLAAERAMTVERPNTIAGLVEKRAEICGRIADASATLRQLGGSHFEITIAPRRVRRQQRP